MSPIRMRCSARGLSSIPNRCRFWRKRLRTPAFLVLAETTSTICFPIIARSQHQFSACLLNASGNWWNDRMGVEVQMSDPAVDARTEESVEDVKRELELN